MLRPIFTVLITIKNSLYEFKLTLYKIHNLLCYKEMGYSICHDGSSSYYQRKLSQVCEIDPSIFVSEKNFSYKKDLHLESQISVNSILEVASEKSLFLSAKVARLVRANKPILHLGPKNGEVIRLDLTEYLPAQHLAETVEALF